MCGILGAFNLRDLDALSFERALDKLAHRGPDDSAILKTNLSGKNCFLGHRRLSIQDTSSAGRQPMSSKCNRVHIVFNGEVYNFKELTSELDQVQLRSRTDTEVLLELYMQDGLCFLKKLNGMFALCIVDERSEEFILARDRVGIKPLYYSILNDGSFLFSSELKGIHTLIGRSLSLDLGALELYLQFQYIPAPQTIFEGVNKLEPGTCLVVGKNGTSKEKYWDIEKSYLRDSTNLSYADSLTQMDNLLRSSIQFRMIADVEVGTFLSGGIDSSLVTAYAASISSKTVKTFSIGFDVDGFNEAKYASKTAAHLGTDHHELYVTPEDALDVIPQLSEFYDEPYADSSAIPTKIVSQLARRSVTVSLSGDGGDELFCGYNRYKWMEVCSSVQNLPGASTVLSSFFRKFPHRLMKKVGALMSWNSPWDQYRSLANIWYKGELEELLLSARESSNPTISAFKSSKSLTENLMYADLQFYLVDDILTKLDRASMSVSLEARVPLLDHRIVEFALSIPLEYKMNRGRTKAPLRDLLSRYVPVGLFERPKAGFAIPLKEWLSGELNDWMKDLLSESSLRKHGYFSKRKIDAMILDLESGSGDYDYQLWTLLMFQDWYRRYCQ